ncbi:DUF1015 domain-containing protein [Marichromatium bheemlicum]|uniref:DUF1015 domain-containing protein n=1 Tax=Marichromatium bheemlicum TaxID=365339 RepID=A0ABX1I9B1_9GAMM|nr:DUF1015 family protein [Marichromatium bheemlicum]NKN32721.1 DUF1015 domain-containing protein [Marichromatium bheemlicum]
MPLIKPFAGLRPAPGRADAVIAPPYDVIDTHEARALVRGRPWSFLHISRAEVDLPEGTDPHDPSVYAQARANLERMLEAGVLVRDPTPSYYVYRLTMDGHRQTGLVAAASVAAYDSGRIKRHEYTRPAKEDDRVRQIEALDAQTGPVFLAYRAQATVDDLLAATTEQPPEVDVTAADGVRHELWRIGEPARIAAIDAAFAAIDALYVADGHHRSAAASRVAAARRETGAASGGAHESFLAVIFPHDQLRILDYNRVVRDLNGHTPETLLAAIAERFAIEPADSPVAPARPGEFGLYLAGHWYRLGLDPRRIPANDPVASLDVSLLQQHLIEPLLGIDDPRRDPRIDFVGGIRGLDGLQQRVDSGEMALALALHPTPMASLLDVADAGAVMPPKSTWFEPKLADGLVSHVLD